MTSLPLPVTSPSRATGELVVNLVAFQAGWFACVLGAARGWPGIALMLAGAVITLHLWLSRLRRSDALLIGVAMAIGLAWDTTMIQSGSILYASPGPLPAWAPAWILALWALFATTLRVPMRWLHRRPALAALLGAIGGPLSYASAVRLGAARIVDAPRAYLLLAIGWAVLTPLLIAVARRLDAPAAAQRIGSP